MKKKVMIIFGTALAVILIVILNVVNKPYQPTSFVADGEIYSASVENGNVMILDLLKGNHDKWKIISTPKSECFASDFSSETDDTTEFHIIALTEGRGAMDFQCTQADGSVKKYKLTLSISRHKKHTYRLISLLLTNMNK